MANLSSQARKEAYEYIKSELTEEVSDVYKRILKREIKSKLPRWARWLPIGKVLDALLPETLLDLLERILLVLRFDERDYVERYGRVFGPNENTESKES